MRKINILIVDDEEKIRFVIKEYAMVQGYNVLEASDGIDAINICYKNDIDLIIMDIMMPKLDGYSAVKEINKDKHIPIIMLSARAEEFDKLMGFELGIDDYVVKPFSPRELMARIKAVLSRYNENKEETQEKNIVFKDLKIDTLGRIVYIKNKRIDLTPKEYELLIFLIKNKNIALSREKILNQVWKYDFYGDNRTVDTHIKMLRNSLGKYRQYIVTVRGMGYKFEE